jgi:hypothetical protein
MFAGFCRDNPFSLKDHKHHGIRFGMWRYHLSGLEADKDNIRACIPEEIFFDRAIW